MESKSRQKFFEEKLERYNRIMKTIEEYKKSDKSKAAELEGEFMIDEMSDLKDFLGDKIKGTKLFTVGETEMTRAELQSELKHLTGFITWQSSQDNPEFDGEIYDMLESECVDIYGTFDFERQLDEEKWHNFGLEQSKPKFDREKIGYANARRNARERMEKNIKAWEKQQEKNKTQELTDASDKSKFRKHETGRGEFGRG